MSAGSYKQKRDAAELLEGLNSMLEGYRRKDNDAEDFGHWVLMNDDNLRAALSARPEVLQIELKVLKEVSDDLHRHGHGLAVARVERMIRLLSAESPRGKQ